MMAIKAKDATTMIYAHVSQSEVQAGHKRCIV